MPRCLPLPPRLAAAPRFPRLPHQHLPAYSKCIGAPARLSYSTEAGGSLKDEVAKSRPHPGDADSVADARIVELRAGFYHERSNQDQAPEEPTNSGDDAIDSILAGYETRRERPPSGRGSRKGRTNATPPSGQGRPAALRNDGFDRPIGEMNLPRGGRRKGFPTPPRSASREALPQNAAAATKPRRSQKAALGSEGLAQDLPRNPPGTRQRARTASKSALGSRNEVLKRGRMVAVTPHGSHTRWASVDVRRNLVRTVLAIWNPKFARIHKRYDDALQSRSTSPEIQDSHAAEWAAKAIRSLNTDDTVALVEDMAIEAAVRPPHLWCRATLWLLSHNLDVVPSFLRATHTASFVPVQCLNDCLMHLAARYNKAVTTGSESTERRDELVDLTCVLAARPESNALALQSGTFRKLEPLCSHIQINELYKALKINHVRVHWHTWLHFATRYAKTDHFEQALDALLEANNAGADLESYAFRSVCATLLRKSIEQPGGLRVCLRIVPNLVRIGVQLNTQLCNIIMLNAVEAGDMKTAISIYHSLLEYGLSPDRYTFAILLKGCKSNIDDAEMLNTIIRDAINAIDLQRNDVVAAEVLHCLSLHHGQHNRTQAYEIVLQAYLQLYMEKPLVQIGLDIPQSAIRIARTRTPIIPPKQAVHILLVTYLRTQINKSSRTSKADFVKEAYEFYRRFRQLAAEGARPFAELHATDYMFNTILMGLLQHRSGLLLATEVIRDMQRTTPIAPGVETPSPTVQTWSIYLKGFVMHKQMRLAEQIIGYMREKGNEPNIVSWNTLLAGYAGEQDMSGSLDTLRRLDEGGMAWDRFTRGGLKRLRDQQTLKKEFEKERPALDVDFTEDLKMAIEDRVAVFGRDDLVTRVSRESSD